MRQSRFIILTLFICLGVLDRNSIYAQALPPNCAPDAEVRSSSGLTTVVGAYPQVSTAARSVSPQPADISLEAGRRMTPTVSPEEYSARKAAMAPHSKASFSDPPTIEISGPATHSPEDGFAP